MPKYYVVHLVKHAPVFYQQTAEQEAKSQTEINEFFLSWSPRVQQVLGIHALGMAGEWDWMGVFAMDELSDWEAFREDYKRRYPGRIEKYLSLPGVSHSEFVRATDPIPHYKELRRLGVYPGQGEPQNKRLSQD